MVLAAASSQEVKWTGGCQWKTSRSTIESISIQWPGLFRWTTPRRLAVYILLLIIDLLTLVQWITFLPLVLVLVLLLLALLLFSPQSPISQ